MSNDNETNHNSAYAGLAKNTLPPYEKNIDDTPVNAAQRWLLPGVLLIGFLFQQLLSHGFERPVTFALLYTGVWLSYIVVFHTLCYKQARSRLIALPFVITAIFLCAMMIAQADGYSDINLLALNALAVPVLLMLHAQIVQHPLPLQKESGYMPLFFKGFFVQPFIHIPRFFKSTGSLFKQGGQSRMVWIGLLIALPVVGVVLALLLSADAVMRSISDNVFHDFDFGVYLIRGMVMLCAAVLFYSFFYGAAWAKPQAMSIRALPVWPALAPRIVVGALLCVYAVFTGVQFLYLFGGYGLPEGLTYADYARQGFSQLIWVAAINLAVFAACLCRVQQDAALRGLLIALLAATGVILASAFTRLGLYIGAYDLTFRRIQAFWLLCYISVVIIACGIRLFRKQLPLLRICALLLVIWYAILNMPDLQALYALHF